MKELAEQGELHAKVTDEQAAAAKGPGGNQSDPEGKGQRHGAPPPPRSASRC
jgi:hypothetical protein